EGNSWRLWYECRSRLVHGVFKLPVSVFAGARNQVQVSCSHTMQQFEVVDNCLERINKAIADKRTPYCFRPVYIVCKGDNGHYQRPVDSLDKDLSNVDICLTSSALSRIRSGCQLLQCLLPELLYAEQLVDNGDHFGSAIAPGSFRCLSPEIVTVDLGADEVRRMQPAMLWARLAQELAKKFPGDLQSVKWLAFLSCSRYTRPANHSRRPRSHAELLSCSPGHVNLGAGNLALCGTCGLHFWPTELSGWQAALGSSDSLPADMMDLSAGQTGILGASLSADLGAVLHELLHCLGLGHTRSGVMARGCDLLRLAVTFLDPATAPASSAPASSASASSAVCYSPDHVSDFRLGPSCAAILSHHPWLNCHRLWQTDDNSKIDCDEEGPADRVSISDGHVISVGSSLCCIEIRSLEPDCLVLHSLVVSDSTVYRIALSSLPLRRVAPPMATGCY
uniref:Peptidase_M10 domain-containing protein n=1 Tax=Macrostomum lignano TaxID=282301 RepID=A0A1I8FZC1_9PLAT